MLLNCEDTEAFREVGVFKYIGLSVPDAAAILIFAAVPGENGVVGCDIKNGEVVGPGVKDGLGDAADIAAVDGSRSEKRSILIPHSQIL